MEDKIKKAICILEVNKLISSSQTEFCESVDLAIKALEEISLYKQGGLCLIPTEVFERQCVLLDEYKELGTLEELRVAKGVYDKMYNTAKEMFKDDENRQREFREKLSKSFSRK